MNEKSAMAIRNAASRYLAQRRKVRYEKKRSKRLKSTKLTKRQRENYLIIAYQNRQELLRQSKIFHTLCAQAVKNNSSAPEQNLQTEEIA